ncbi:hypothetical protein MAR_003344 [Mya arenaria]|uniref:Uncharacterized protein n=1 Tax=Mya arenaria TaxID=6604 RepID=A0ABY7G9T5_MYAAR|nr:hypothetical protein MAR_003344 [Mya arenaria]
MMLAVLSSMNFRAVNPITAKTSMVIRTLERNLSGVSCPNCSFMSKAIIHHHHHATYIREPVGEDFVTLMSELDV